MKKHLSYGIIVILVFQMLLSACGNNSSESVSEPEDTISTIETEDNNKEFDSIIENENMKSETEEEVTAEQVETEVTEASLLDGYAYTFSATVDGEYKDNIFQYNIPMDYSIEGITTGTYGCSFSLYYDKKYLSFSFETKADEYDYEKVDTVITPYGELDIGYYYGGEPILLREEASFYVDDINIYARAYISESDSGTTEYSGMLKPLLSIMFEPNDELPELILPELIDKNIDVSDKNYDYIFGEISNNSEKKYYAFNLTDNFKLYTAQPNVKSNGVTLYKTVDFDDAEKTRPTHISISVDEILLNHFFTNKGRFKESIYGKILAKKEVDEVDTAFGTAKVYLVNSQKDEWDYISASLIEGPERAQEVALLKNNDGYVLFVTYCSNSYDDTYDGYLSEILHKL